MEGWDAGDNAEAIANTPAMQIFQKKGIEVLASDLVSLRAVFRYRHQIVPFLATCSRRDLENPNRKKHKRETFFGASMSFAEVVLESAIISGSQLEFRKLLALDFCWQNSI